MSCRRGSGKGLRRRWAEFPLVRVVGGRADHPDTRPFVGRQRAGLEYAPTLEDQLAESPATERKEAS